MPVWLLSLIGVSYGLELNPKHLAGVMFCIKVKLTRLPVLLNIYVCKSVNKMFPEHHILKTFLV